MTSQPTSRRRNAGPYQPSDAELKAAADLVTRLTPSPDAYKEYRLLADFYMDAVGPVVRRQQAGVLKGLRMWGSMLFAGQEYLIGQVADEWLAGVAPTCDAICSTMTEPLDQLAEGMQLPPLVFVPVSKRGARSSAFVSVVEHEIVHLNQAILGTCPVPPAGRGAEDLLEFFVTLAGAEYEASFVQLARWPETFPADSGVSLHHWCLVRGYSQALEHALLLSMQLDFPAHACQGFLESLESHLPDLLRRIGASEDVIPWFLERLTTHVYLAISSALSHMPAAAEHAAFRAAGRWLRPRLKAAGIQLGSKR